MTETQKTKQHGRLYYLFENLGKKGKVWWKNNRFTFIVSLVVIASLTFIFREEFQPGVIFLRQYFFLGTIGVALSYPLYRMIKVKNWKLRIFAAALIALVAGSLWLTSYEGVEPYQYLALYNRYNSLPIVTLEKQPLTGHERIMPDDAVLAVARGSASGEEPMPPDFVRIGNEFRYTLAIEPAVITGRFGSCIKEIINVSGTEASVDFSHRDKVNFCVGENLLLGKKTATAVTRSFGIERFLSYEPSDIRYMPNDAGEWVEVVSLIHWKGMFFPYPEFGGVQVINQDPTDQTIWQHMTSMAERTLFGKGTWIRPKDIDKYPFLQGQSIKAKEVSTYIANSIKFHNGLPGFTKLLGPMPGFHKNDVRIPNVKQPATTYCSDAVPGGLYHYFGMAPWQTDKHGLNPSVFIPADGSDTVYLYDHIVYGEHLKGLEDIFALVRDTKKAYLWPNIAAEHRPYIRDINGQRRFLVLTTIGTFKDIKADVKTANSSFETSVPEVAITDPAIRKTIWVDVYHPENWTKAIAEEIAPLWK